MVEDTLAFNEPEVQADKLMEDQGHDCDVQDEALAQLDMEMIAPHLNNRRPDTTTLDSRPLHSLQRRGVMERTTRLVGESLPAADALVEASGPLSRPHHS